jgi:hypothetical protein
MTAKLFFLQIKNGGPIKNVGKLVLYLRQKLITQIFHISLPNSYSFLNDKISFSVLLWFPVTKKCRILI